MAYSPHNSTQSETVIGATNRVTHNTNSFNQMKLNFAPRYGVITRVELKGGSVAVPFVIVRWNDTNQESVGWIALEDHPSAISANYSRNLQDLIGYTVKVTKRTATDATGIGKLVANTKFDPDSYDLELPSSGVKL